MGTDRSAPPSIVIFGASGDLTSRKLLPALFNLYRKGRLLPDAKIIGYSRRPWDYSEFRAIIRSGIDKFAAYHYSEKEWSEFEQFLFHVQGGFTDAEDYKNLAKQLSEINNGSSTNCLYYLAVPPQYFIQIVTGLAGAGLVREDGAWRRVVIEKPFGHDLASARELNKSIHKALNEHQVYRIDHYLGKETVQNVLVFRFANTIFEPIWNRNYIDHVQITVAEKVGVGHRAGYYDGVGIIRDMFQNHLLQLLTLVAMEPPATFEANSLRNEKTKVLSAVRPIPPEAIRDYLVRGQYEGYKDEQGAAIDSETATFSVLRLNIDNWRWQGVPFFLRSGKMLAEKSTQIIIHFKSPPHRMFPLPPGYEIKPNILTLCIQPDEGIHLLFDAKVPDTTAETRPVDMGFHYAESFGGTAIPDAYERLLLDSLHGDASLFTRSDEIELAWRLIDPVIQAMDSPYAPPLAYYKPGSWGPDQADTFLAKDGRQWLQGCGMHA
jgi:glucose-6-phosphate 1-dehydrogenase